MTMKLSRLFRYSINQSQEDLVPVQEEMEIVRTYLDIEKVRFGERIDFSICVDESLKNARIPRFLIQPLVENALKHGLNNVTSGGELKVQISGSDKIVISVADNGAPFPAELGLGYGLQSTYDKLDLLYPNAYEVQILNQPIKEVKIQMPLTNG
jgi:two-component system LytT family sensor kinase